MDTMGRSSSTIALYINENVMKRINEIVDIENTTKQKLIQKMVENYVPIPAIIQEGEFRTILQRTVGSLYRVKPHAIVACASICGKIGMPLKVFHAWRHGIITWEEFRRKYIERLMLPDAQEEIKRLKKLRQSQDVYISSWETDEEHSMRKIFVDFVSGKLVWT